MTKDENGLPDGVNADSPNPGERRSNDEGIITESAGGVKQAPPAPQTTVTGLTPESLDRLNQDMLEQWALPAARHQGYRVLWLRVAGSDPPVYALPRVTGEDSPTEVTLPLKKPIAKADQAERTGQEVNATDIDWDTLRADPEHLLLDIVEVRLPGKTPPEVYFNEKADPDVFAWAEKFAEFEQQEAEQHPEGRVELLAPGDMPTGLRAAEEARVKVQRPYGLIVWDLARGRLYTSVTQEALSPAGRALAVRRTLPPELHQQTFAEIRTVQRGLSDGPTAGTTGSSWAYSPPERCAIHTVPPKENKDKWPLQTRFDPTEIPQKWAIYEPSGDEGKDAGALFALLRETGTDAALLMNVAVAAAILTPKQLYDFDLFVAAAGEAPRTKDQWREAREKTWLRLRTIMAMRPIGRRIGSYYDRHTREHFDLQVNDPLLRIVHTVDPVQPPLDSPTPVAISLDGGAWIEKYRTDARVLTYFGNILKLSQITSGRPSGAWARCIGMNLNQAWRESAKDATVTTRDGGRLVKSAEWAFTRRDLLDGMVTVSPEHNYQAMLDSENPSRARRAFDEAMNILQARGVVGTWRCLSPKPAGRKAWKATWLDEEIAAAPGREGAGQAIEIATAHRKAMARLKRNKAAKAKAKAAEADSKKPE